MVLDIESRVLPSHYFFGQSGKVSHSLSHFSRLVGRNGGDSTFGPIQPQEQILAPFFEAVSLFDALAPEFSSLGVLAAGSVHLLPQLFALAGDLLEELHRQLSVQNLQVLLDPLRSRSQLFESLKSLSLIKRSFASQMPTARLSKDLWFYEYLKFYIVISFDK